MSITISADQYSLMMKDINEKGSEIRELNGYKKLYEQSQEDNTKLANLDVAQKEVIEKLKTEFDTIQLGLTESRKFIDNKEKEEKDKNEEIKKLKEFKQKALDENTASAVCEDMMGRIDNLEKELVKEQNEVKVYTQSAKLWEHRYDTIKDEVEFIPSKILNENNIHFDNITTDETMGNVIEAFFTLVSNYDHPFFDWNNELVKREIYCVEWYDFVYQTMGMGEAENQNRFRDENVADEYLEEWKTDEEEVYYYYIDGDVYYK